MTNALVPVDDADLVLRTDNAMRALGKRITEQPEITRALAAAESLKEGLVIHDDAEAAQVVDLTRTVLDGAKYLDDAVRGALRIPRQMEEAVKGAVQPTRDLLARAKETAGSARVAYQNTLRRRAAEAEEKARQAAQEAAQRAAEEAVLTGEDVPPPVQVAPVEVPRTVAGGTGKMGTQVRIEPVAVVDRELVPMDWWTFAPAMARAAFNAAVQRGEVKKPEPGSSTVWWGVRFEARETAVNRRA